MLTPSDARHALHTVPTQLMGLLAIVWLAIPSKVILANPLVMLMKSLIKLLTNATANMGL
jgi:hypothetical protein